MTARPDDLLAELAGAHDFTGAPCVGEWAVMDAGGPAAADLCARCPKHHLDACGSVLASLPVAARTGTWAGVNYGTTKRSSRCPTTACSSPAR